MPENIYSLDENFSKSAIETISNTNKQRLEDTYKEVFDPSHDLTKIERLIRETREMIPQIDSRIHYWEDRRTQFLQLSIGILAAALAGIVAISPQLFMKFENNEFVTFSTTIYIPVVVLSICLVIGTTKLLILWNQQNNPPYPFTKGTKTWRWQYRHAETTETDTNFQKFDRSVMEKQAYIFANNLIDYKIKTVTSDEKELLDQDLSQLYLLLINEKFKIKFVSQLRDLLIKWLIISGVAALVTFFLTILTLIVEAIFQSN
jgi:hypothetical protein